MTMTIRERLKEFKRSQQKIQAIKLLRTAAQNQTGICGGLKECKDAADEMWGGDFWDVPYTIFLKESKVSIDLESDENFVANPVPRSAVLDQMLIYSADIDGIKMTSASGFTIDGLRKIVNRI